MAWPPHGGSDDDQLICEAHRHGVRVIYGAPNDLPFEGNATEKTAYVRKLVDFVQDNFLDGVTFDYESPADAGTPLANGYIDIIRQATAALHEAVPGSQTSVCAAWSPNGIDGRFYDYKSLADASDLLYVMGYDTRSQIFDRCLAGANCPAPIARSGLEQYLARSIPAEKLILGVPWYGYRYPCKAIESNTSKYCELAFKPFRGVNCSDAAGTELAYKDVMVVARSADMLTDVMWDETSQTPFFNFRCSDSPVGVCQMWFDNPTSLAAKYSIAGELGIRGVGPYQFKDVDWDTSAQSRTEAQAMYTAFDAFLNYNASSSIQLV
jgi:di-N-acetylchitobiase